MPIIFFKIFNSFFMNGFMSPGAEKRYWITSYISVILFCIGFFAITKESLLITPYEQKDFFKLGLNSLFYISLFSIISSLPIISHLYFNSFLEDSFPYWYVKYVWRKERTKIMGIISELPPEIISTQEISFLSNHNGDLENKQIQIIRKVWTRNLAYMMKYNKGSM